MIVRLLILGAITLVPALELRASIPYGFFGLKETVPWPVTVLVCTVVNVLLGLAVFRILAPVFEFIRRWGWFDRVIWPILDRTRHRIHPYVEKYGELGVAVFIGIPLPGSGVYTGAFGAYLIGVDKRKFAIANLLGVIIAACAVTGICLLIDFGIIADESWVKRLFIKHL